MKKSIGFLLISLFILIVSCSVNDAEHYEYSKWTFSGYIVDGTNNQPLANATLSYLNEEGSKIVVKADSAGAFFVESLPYGSKAFTVSYTYKGKKDTVVYGTRFLTVGSTSESASMEGIIASAVRIIRLFPLNGGITGELFFTEEETKKQAPAVKIRVNLSYRDSSFVNETGSCFTTETDSLGNFVFKNIPADTGYSLSFSPLIYKNSRYTASSVSAGKVLPAQTLDLGRTLMSIDTLIEKSPFILASNVLDKNGLGLREISPVLEPYFVMKEALSSENLKVTLTYSKDTSFTVSPVLRNDTLFLKHAIQFPINKVISVEIFGYIKKTGERVHLVLTGKSSFETSRGLYVVSSNVDPNYSGYKGVFAVGDTIWIHFSESLASNLDRIQWKKSATANISLYGYGALKNVEARVKKDTLFMKILPVIEEDDLATLGPKLGFDITVYSTSGLKLPGVSFLTELDYHEPTP